MDSPNTIELYPYQIECLESLRENLRKGKNKQILCAPTGSGKTVIAGKIAELSSERGHRTMFVCDRQTLVTQTSDRFTEMGIKHGIIMSKHTHSPHQLIQIASAQTLQARQYLNPITDNELFSSFDHRPDLIIIDECHEKRKYVLDMAKSHNIPMIGLSATPMTSGLSQYYDEVVNLVTTQKLLHDGYLTPVRVVIAEKEANTEGLEKNYRGEWKESQVSDRVFEIIGDIVPEWEKQTEKFFGNIEKTIVFGASVADCLALEKEFQQRGYPFSAIHYQQSLEEKEAQIEKFRQGEIVGLISCVALTKGFDVPDAKIMVDAQPVRKSFARQMQKIGRIMRTAKEKENALLIDHAGNYLGFWAQMQAFFNTGVPSLPEAEQTGKTVRESDGKSHLICPKCRFVMETPGWKICDECGYEKPKRTLRPERSQALIPGAVREINGIEATQDFSCDWWIEIISYYSRFYRRAPAKWRRISLAKYREIFGVWPDKKFVPHHKIPDKNVALILDTMYQQYKEGKKK